MGTCSFRDLIKVLKKMGFDEYLSKKGSVWVGVSPISGELTQILVHCHAKGRDIADGTFQTYWKQLGFQSKDEFIIWRNKNI